MKDLDHLNMLYRQFPDAIMPRIDDKVIMWLTTAFGDSFTVKISVPNFPSSQDVKVIGAEEAVYLVSSFKEEYDSICSDSSTVDQFMLKFESFLRSVYPKATDSKEVSTLSKLHIENKVLDQIKEMGWSKVETLDPKITVIKLKYKDSTERQQFLQLRIPEDYSKRGCIIDSQLPNWKPGQSDKMKIAEIYDTWVQAVEELIPVWSILQEIDRILWVLDPDPPGLVDMYRRVAIGPYLSVHIQLNHLNPLDVPDLKFFGPTEKVAPLRERFEEKLEDWDFEDDLIINLERILDVEFPSKHDISRDELKLDCAICFSFHCEGRIPSVVCPVARCSSFYHDSCLYKWLHSLPDSRLMLDMVFGLCPYCKSPISCQKPPE